MARTQFLSTRILRRFGHFSKRTDLKLVKLQFTILYYFSLKIRVKLFFHVLYILEPKNRKSGIIFYLLASSYYGLPYLLKKPYACELLNHEYISVFKIFRDCKWWRFDKILVNCKYCKYWQRQQKKSNFKEICIIYYTPATLTSVLKCSEFF